MHREIPVLLALVLASGAMAAPPPPPPMGTLRGPASLCSPLYGLRLLEGEVAQQYVPEYWVVTAPGLDLGIRTDLEGLEGTPASVTVPDLGAGQRRAEFEWPGNRPRGWAYAFGIRRGEAAATCGSCRISSAALMPTIRCCVAWCWAPPAIRSALRGAERTSLPHALC